MYGYESHDSGQQMQRNFMEAIKPKFRHRAFSQRGRSNQEQTSRRFRSPCEHVHLGCGSHWFRKERTRREGDDRLLLGGDKKFEASQRR